MFQLQSTMELKTIILAALAILSVKLVHGLDPTARVKVTKSSLETLPNPYFGNCAIEVFSPGNILSLKLPAKKDIPETMMMSVYLEFAGVKVAEVEVSLCEALADPVYTKKVLEKGIPKGKFPTKCPIKAGLDYEIFKYECDDTHILPGLPDDYFIVNVKVYEPDNDPIVLVHVEGDLTHSSLLPGVPSFGR